MTVSASGSLSMSLPAVLLADYNPEDVKPGWIALVLVVVLALATYLLWRSMNKQLRRIDVPTKAELRNQQAGEPAPQQPPPDPDDKTRTSD